MNYSVENNSNSGGGMLSAVKGLFIPGSEGGPNLNKAAEVIDKSIQTGAKKLEDSINTNITKTGTILKRKILNTEKFLKNDEDSIYYSAKTHIDDLEKRVAAIENKLKEQDKPTVNGGRRSRARIQKQKATNKRKRTNSSITKKRNRKHTI
jgi:hypothetical protein